MPRKVEAVDVDVGKRIRLRRLELGMSQTELANQLKVTFQQVQKYEKGKNRVGAARLHRISSALGVPVEFFFGRVGKRKMADSLMFVENIYGLRLLRAFASITDADVQKRIVVLVESLADGQARSR